MTAPDEDMPTMSSNEGKLVRRAVSMLYDDEDLTILARKAGFGKKELGVHVIDSDVYEVYPTGRVMARTERWPRRQGNAHARLRNDEIPLVPIRQRHLQVHGRIIDALTPHMWARLEELDNDDGQAQRQELLAALGITEHIIDHGKANYLSTLDGVGLLAVPGGFAPMTRDLCTLMLGIAARETGGAIFGTRYSHRRTRTLFAGEGATLWIS